MKLDYRHYFFGAWILIIASALFYIASDNATITKQGQQLETASIVSFVAGLILMGVYWFTSGNTKGND